MDKIYIFCKNCGNLRMDGVVEKCCGDDMVEIIPNTEDADFENHIPVVERVGDILRVDVGEIAHPMTEEHHIRYIYLKTNMNLKKAPMKIGENPMTTFILQKDEMPEEVLAYCNLHGVWTDWKEPEEEV